MIGFLRKLFGHQRSPQVHLTDEDTDLTQFYTNTEHALREYEQLVTATNLPKRLLVVHGLGGVGKSTLLKMYLLSGRRHHIPVALIASEDALSPADVLAGWADDLSHNGIPLSTFQKTLTHYRAIQAKVEAEAKKTHQTGSQLASELGKTAAKTAIDMAASAVPIVGPLIGVVGGQSADAFIDWLHSFLSKPDMDLYLDPVKRLNADFLSDLTRAAAHQRLVLMVDTYEQMTALDEWMRDLTRRLPQNVLLVIASRTVPAWERAWQGWMGKAEIIELREMTSNDLQTLVHRYHAYVRGGDPDPRQVEAIVQFARGLPMVATTVVQLWVKYGAEDFQAMRPQVVADLADRLLEGVPKEMRPAFETAAVLRYFNVDVLGALPVGGDAEVLYSELRLWPFIRTRQEGLAIHDTMREMISEALRVRTPERFRKLHERARVYYETRLEKASGDERERYTAERLYHHICADEGSGIQLFQELAEELTRYRMASQLQVLLNDVNNYPIERENSRLWREYYNARLAHLGGQFTTAEKIYQAIGENEAVEPKLRAYALCDWGAILRRRERLLQLGGEEKAIRVLESSLSTGVSTDLKLAMSYVYLGDVYSSKGEWKKAVSFLEYPKAFYTERKDYSGLVTTLEFERRIYRREGDLHKTFDIAEEMWRIYQAAGEPFYLRTRVPPEWEWAWDGRYAEREKELRISIEVIRSLQDQEILCARTQVLALCLGFQERYTQAEIAIEECLALARSLDSTGELELFAGLTTYGIMCFKSGKLDRAEEYLNQAVVVGKKLHIHLDAVFPYLAAIYEIQKAFDKAEHFYRLSYDDAHPVGRHYHECDALTGLVRVKHAKLDYAAIPKFWTEAEQLAQQYEYNDHSAILNLARGHLIWEGLIPEWGSGLDSALHHYRQALIYALRFNRFLLDEVLSGREQGTPLRPIIPYCLERGEEGLRMLVALLDWWQSGANDIGIPRPDTISPMPEGSPLLETESIARDRELGNGSPQKRVSEQINEVLKMADRN
jgi:tetratricopeptide (TPR) repeat protein